MDKKVNLLTENAFYENGTIKFKGGGREAVWQSLDTHGYKRLAVCGVHMLAHRAVWALCNQSWPEGEIDHINGDKTDNRIENLRLVSRKENMRNLRRFKNNTSGFNGIHWEKSRRKWRVTKGKVFIGRFSCLGRAIGAELTARGKLGYDPEHGKGNAVG